MGKELDKGSEVILTWRPDGKLEAGAGGEGEGQRRHLAPNHLTCSAGSVLTASGEEDGRFVF